MRNENHGHVVPRPDGDKARCGGPAFCRQCGFEESALHVGARNLELRKIVIAKDTEISRLALELKLMTIERDKYEATVEGYENAAGKSAGLPFFF